MIRFSGTPASFDGVLTRALAAVFAATAATALLASPATAQEPPRTVQPGAPGQVSQVVAAGSAHQGFPKHDAADVQFMQMMVAHHAQALQMSELVPDRSTREDVRLLAHRIHMAQFDEIKMMAQWLHDRGEVVPELAFELGFEPAAPAGAKARAGMAGMDHATMDHAAHAAPPAADHSAHAGHDMSSHDMASHDDHDPDAHDHTTMAGMLSPEQLAELAAASGETFDRLFLEFMIYHHEGAISMVRDLFASPMGGQEGEIYQFAAHVDSDQRIEIQRMRGMLAPES